EFAYDLTGAPHERDWLRYLGWCGQMRVYRNGELVYQSTSRVHFLDRITLLLQAGDELRITVESPYPSVQGTQPDQWPSFVEPIYLVPHGYPPGSGVEQPLVPQMLDFGLAGSANPGGIYFDRTFEVLVPDPEFEVRDLNASAGEFDPTREPVILAATLFSRNLTSPGYEWTVRIKDASGAVVREFPGTGQFVTVSWDGTDRNGADVPDGTYVWEVEGEACEDAAGGGDGGSSGSGGDAGGVADGSGEARAILRHGTVDCLTDAAEATVSLTRTCSVKVELPPDADVPSNPPPDYSGMFVRVEPDGYPDGTQLNRVRLPVRVRLEKLPPGQTRTDVTLEIVLGRSSLLLDGHHHEGPGVRPVGKFLETGGTTFTKTGMGVGETFTLTFVPSEFAGDVNLVASCHDSDTRFGRVVQVRKAGLQNFALLHAKNRDFFRVPFVVTRDGVLCVGGAGPNDNEPGVPGYVSDPNGTWVGPEPDLPDHPDQHYASPELNQAVFAVARKYQAKTGETLRVNDMALPFGGRFDLGPNVDETVSEFWTGHHYEHRGDAADLNSLTYFNTYADTRQGQDDLLIQIIDDTGLNVKQEGNHPHVWLKEQAP
ncbi:MAG: FlgD immunoglobulin-like domain containing protein, partial [Candidatus Eremiobacterota bacterium]